IVVVRVGRYGPYLQRGEERASIPNDLAPDELTIDRALELLAAPSSDRELGADPETGLVVSLRTGRFGPYVQLGEQQDAKDKPPRASLFKSMAPESVTLDQALELLHLPRTVGVDPTTGEEIIARNGRYGPYLQRGTDTRSLDAEERILDIGLDEAVALFAQPKQRRFGRQAAAPAREIGIDPETSAKIVLREGRFGPYVTDGTVNASLRRGDDMDSITLERAADLLAERRAAGPGKRRSARAAKKPAKKVAKKRATAKKAATKKAAAKKKAPTRSRTGAADPGEEG
ncbi:MAG: topoisomerase C-terminal repeat-containing protein, partial [Acidimicrobiales bacterium]